MSHRCADKPLIFPRTSDSYWEVEDAVIDEERVKEDLALEEKRARVDMQRKKWREEEDMIRQHERVQKRERVDSKLANYIQKLKLSVA